jgi:hypothetical protein
MCSCSRESVSPVFNPGLACVFGSEGRSLLAAQPMPCSEHQLGKEGGRVICCSVPLLFLHLIFLQDGSFTFSLVSIQPQSRWNLVV